MGSHQDAGIFLIGLPQSFANFNRLGIAAGEVIGFPDAAAGFAQPAKIRQIARRWCEAVHGFGQHLRQRVLARAFRSGEDDCMGKAIARQHGAQVANHRLVAEKILEAHKEILLGFAQVSSIEF